MWKKLFFWLGDGVRLTTPYKFMLFVAPHLFFSELINYLMNSGFTLSLVTPCTSKFLDKHNGYFAHLSADRLGSITEHIVMF